MSNHIHMVVTPEERDGLSILMKRCKQRYAQIRNRNREGSGSLFEARFKSEAITCHTQLMFTTLYNDANGFRAGLSKSADSHEWSTGPIHAAAGTSRIPPAMWTPSVWYLSLGATTRDRAVAYQEAMRSYVEKADANPNISNSVVAAEKASSIEYTLRLERPDRSSAREVNFSRKPRFSLSCDRDGR